MKEFEGSFFDFSRKVRPQIRQGNPLGGKKNFFGGTRLDNLTFSSNFTTPKKRNS
jgi:hypothetical protein